MRRVPRINNRQAQTSQAGRTRRLPRRWLAAALITGAVALLAPGVSYATASQSAPATAAAGTGTDCRGVTPAVFPAVGFITNPARTQGGHLWFRRSADGTSVCVGTVVEWVQYNSPMTKTWRVIVYSARHPDGLTVARNTFTLGRGWYFWSFHVRQPYLGLTAVCLTADESFGMACIHFTPPQG